MQVAELEITITVDAGRLEAAMTEAKGKAKAAGKAVGANLSGGVSEAMGALTGATAGTVDKAASGAKARAKAAGKAIGEGVVAGAAEAMAKMPAPPRIVPPRIAPPSLDAAARSKARGEGKEAAGEVAKGYEGAKPPKVADLAKGIAAEAAKARAAAGAQGSSIGQSLASGFGMAVGNLSVQGLVQGVKSLVGTMIESSAAFEDFNTQFEVMLGSKTKAKAFYDDLNKMAIQTPFEMNDLAKASQTLLSFGMDAKTIMPTLRMIGDVSLGNKDKFDRLSLAFAQIQSTGRLMGQDLLQLVNAGFNPLTIISQKTGMSMADLKKRMEAGGISAKSVADAFKVATSEGGRFYGGMDKGSRTFNGLLSTLKDNIHQTLREVGKPAFDALKKALEATIKAMGDPAFQSFAKTLAVIVAGVVAVVGAVAGIAAAMSAWGKLVSVFQLVGGAIGGIEGAIALLTGPVGWIIGAAVLIYAAWKTNFLGIRDFVMSAVGDIVAWWQENLPLIRATSARLLTWLRAAWGAFVAYWKEVWNAAMKIIVPVWEFMKGIVMGAVHAIQGLLSAAMMAINGKWSAAWDTMRLTVLRVWADIGAGIARAAANVLGTMQRFMSAMMSMGGGSFNGFDGVIKGAQNMATGLEATSRAAGTGLAAIRGNIGMGGVTQFAKQGPRSIAPMGVRMPEAAPDFSDLGDEKAKKGKKGKKGAKEKKEKLTDEQREERSQIEEYQRLIRQLTQDIALNGNAAESAALKYKIEHGEIAGGAKVYAQRALALLRSKEAHEAARESAKKYAEAMKEQTERLKAVHATDDRDRASLQLFGKHFADLTDKASRWKAALLGVRKVQADGEEKEKERLAQMRQNAKGMIESSQQEIDATQVKTRAQKAAYELGKAEYKGLEAASRLAIMANAELLDAMDETAARRKIHYEAWLRASQAVWSRALDAAKALGEAKGRWNAYMAELDDRLTKTLPEADQMRAKMRALTAEFGGGELGARRAGVAMREMLRVEKAERFAEEMDRVRHRVEDGFMDMADRIWHDGFGSLFSNVLGGFRSMIADMAKEWAMSQLRTGIGNLIGGMLSNPGRGAGLGGPWGAIVNAGMGGMKSGGKRSVGGPVLAHHAYEWQEDGREFFVPNTDGRVLTAAQTKAAGGGGDTYHLHIATPDAGSFMPSRGQSMAERARELATANRRR